MLKLLGHTKNKTRKRSSSSSSSSNKKPHIIIDGKKLNYLTKTDEYIITYMKKYPTSIQPYIEDLNNDIHHLYKVHHSPIKHKNVCGPNSKKVCKFLNKKYNENMKVGKILIRYTDWKDPNDFTMIDNIKEVYGNNASIIGVSFHVIVYIELKIENRIYYIAVETTIGTPYKLQFYIGKNEEEFTTIIKSRYNCNSYTVMDDCDKDVYEYL